MPYWFCPGSSRRKRRNIGGAHFNLQAFLLLLSKLYACKPYIVNARCSFVRRMSAILYRTAICRLPIVPPPLLSLDTNRMNTSWFQNLLGGQECFHHKEVDDHHWSSHRHGNLFGDVLHDNMTVARRCWACFFENMRKLA